MRDLAIIAGCQKVEHYEISGYGTARAMAEKLGMEEAVELLQQTEEEETAADSTLTEVAATIYDSSEEDEEDSEDTEVKPVVKTAAMGSLTSSGTSKRGPKKTTR